MRPRIDDKVLVIRTYRLHPDTAAKLKRIAIERGESASTIAREIIALGLERYARMYRRPEEKDA